MTEVTSQDEEYDSEYLRAIRAICAFSWGLLPFLSSAWVDGLLGLVLMLVGMGLISFIIFYWASSMSCFPGEYEERESKKE